jgi:Holliday junction resolvase-like predicted endonuclease
MNSKAKGSRLEHKTIHLLESVGYQCIRSAGSLGPFDIVATHKLGVRFIQVKANGWPRPEEREELAAAAQRLPLHSCLECWRWDDNARQPMIRYIEEFLTCS